MMLLARLQPRVAVAAALILATAGIVAQGRQQPAPAGAQGEARTTAPPAAGAGTGGAAAPDIAANQALARKQLALVDEALASLQRLARDARVSMADPAFSLWGRRKLETLHRTGAGKAEIVAALEKYINSLKEDEAIAEGMHQGARATKVTVYDVQYRRMEAEIWLNEEKAR